jgi:hypothetical protein
MAPSWVTMVFPPKCSGKGCGPALKSRATLLLFLAALMIGALGNVKMLRYLEMHVCSR